MRWIAALAVIPALAQTAGRSFTVEQLATAPVLVVGVVEAIAERPTLPGSDRRHPRYAGPAVATMRVLRASRQLKAKVIRISFDGRGASAVIEGPRDPVFVAKEVYIVPLEPGGAEWRAVEKNETTTILPGVAPLSSSAPATTARTFLLREINNVLVNGSVKQMSDIAAFFRLQSSPSLPAEVIATLHTSLPSQSSRFRELAAVFLASSLLSGDDLLNVPSERLVGAEQIASVLFHEIPEPDRMKRVLRTLVRWVGDVESPYQFLGHVHSTLIPRFSGDLVELMQEELVHPQPGTICVAWWLAESGERTMLSASVAGALLALRMKNIVGNDLIGAGRIIVNYGDDAQFADYLLALAEARSANDPRYDAMWWVVEIQKGRRILRILASILQDDRLSQRTTYYDHGKRYSEVAGLRLQQLLRVNFGFTSSGNQGAAVARARKWANANL